MALEKTLERPLDCKEIQPVHSEGDQPWDFFGRNDAKAEQIQKIAETKMPDLNAASLEAAMSMIAGTARSMGVLVVD